MPENTTLYRLGLSAFSALLLGGLAGLIGMAWALALGTVMWPVGVLAAIGAFWGAVVVHLTPTGGTITENRTTVNYAVFALHGWYTFFLCLIALLILAIRSWAF